MRSFTEACEATFMETDHGRTPEECLPVMLQRTERYEEIQQEVQEHRITEGLCATILMTTEREGLDVEIAMQAAFAHGVVVGLKMNEMEIPEAWKV